MDPEIPQAGQLRTMIQKLVRDEITDYFNSEAGKGHLVRLLDELENDDGMWIAVTTAGKEDAGHEHESENVSKLVSLIRSARKKLTREEYIAVLHLGREGAREDEDD